MQAIIQDVLLWVRCHRWSFLLIFSAAAYFYILSAYSLWFRVGIPPLKTPFADMQAILAAADAYREGYNPFIENPYDPLGRVHVYGRPWLWLGYTGINLSHTNVAAVILTVLFLLMSASILKPGNFKEFAMSAMLLLSPAVMLGLERGNNDLIIFVMLGLAGCLVHNRNFVLHLSAYPLMYLASILKFYPIASFLLFIKTIKRPLRFWVLALLSMFIFGAILILWYADFEYLNTEIPRPHGRYTFGAAILFEWLLCKWPVNLGFVYAMTGIAFILAFLLSSKTGLAEVKDNSVNSIFFLIGSLNLLFCFFTNTNYDYRCIYFILILPWLLKRLNSPNTPATAQRYIKILFCLLPIVTWNEMIITLIGLNLGGPGISEAKFIAIVSVYILEHVSTWVVITIILSFCIELLKAPLKEKTMVHFGGRLWKSLR
jgi:hypothetical protein